MRQLLKLTPTRRDDAANILAAHEEIRGTIELKTIGGAVGKDDAAMLGGVLDLRDLKVLDIMVHRTKMQTIDVGQSPQKVIEAITNGPYTRVPLWRDEPENIVGVLHTKDLLVALASVNWDLTKIDIAGVAAAPWFVPDSTSVADQLWRQRQHLPEQHCNVCYQNYYAYGLHIVRARSEQCRDSNFPRPSDYKCTRSYSSRIWQCGDDNQSPGWWANHRRDAQQPSADQRALC